MPPPGPRATGRGPQPLALALLAGLVAFTAQALWTRRFFVSVPYWDEWNDLFGFLATYAAGMLDWSGMFAQHMEHRIPVARVFFLLVYSVFGEGNLLALLMISALLMGVIAGVWTYTIRRLGEPIWLAAASVLVLTSISQFENMLWGFQVEFYLLVLPVLASICWIALAPRLTWGGVLASAAACAVSSYSIASGLSAWAAVGLTLFLRVVSERRSLRGVLAARREWRQMIAFLAIGGSVTFAYLHGYVQLHPIGAGMRGPVEMLRWSSVALVFPIIDPLVRSEMPWLPCVVTVVFLPIVLALRLYWRERDHARLLLMAGILLMVCGNVGIMGFGRSGIKFVASRYGTVCLWTSVMSLMAIASLLRHARGRPRSRILLPVLALVAAGLVGAHVWRYVTFVPKMAHFQWIFRIFQHNVVSYLADASPDRQLPAFLPFPAEPVKPLLSDDLFLSVLPYNLRPPMTATATGDAWTIDGVPPQVDARGFFTWGSWSGAGTHTGTLTSTPLAGSKPLVVAIAGYPSRAGNAIALESALDPGRRLVYAGPDPGERWIEWRIDASQRPGGRVRLVAIDGAQGPEGWIGVGLPIPRSAAVWALETVVPHLELWVAPIALVLLGWVIVSGRDNRGRGAGG